MEQLADDLYQLKGFPPDAINVWLMGDVIVDAASRHAGKRILRQVEGRPVSAHALTHAHPDHQGASREICRTLGIPYWVPEGDVPVAETGDFGRFQETRFPSQISRALYGGPGHPVDRRLNEGDEVAGFQVLHVPGHTDGHVAYWRESDRSLILGDVLNNMHLLTGVRGLREPPKAFTPDPARNRESARRLAALEPALVLFGHGPPLRDTRRFVDFVSSLP
ncbi:MAG TPA: MBL fold metallo-hydrolase [Thermoleophilaceae bacterium]